MLKKPNKLKTELKTKEKAYIYCPSLGRLQDTAAVRSTLHNLLTEDEESKFRFAMQRFYKHGDKLGKYLTRLSK